MRQILSLRRGFAALLVILLSVVCTCNVWAESQEPKESLDVASSADFSATILSNSSDGSIEPIPMTEPDNTVSEAAPSDPTSDVASSSTDSGESTDPMTGNDEDQPINSGAESTLTDSDPFAGGEESTPTSSGESGSTSGSESDTISSEEGDEPVIGDGSAPISSSEESAPLGSNDSSVGSAESALTVSGAESEPNSSENAPASSNTVTSQPPASSATQRPASSRPNSSRYTAPTPTISPEWNDELNSLYNNACDWLKQQQNGDLFFIAMGCAGRQIDSKQYGVFLGTVSNSTYTELYPLALAALDATFCGIQATNVNGTDLIRQITDFPGIQNADAGSLAYALLALDSNPYETAETAKNSRQDFVDALLTKQNKDGSFQTANEDILSVTAIALSALSKYSSDNNVRDALNDGVSYLQTQYQKNGFKKENSIVISRIISALTCLKININDSRFTKNGKNLCDQLLDYIGNDGGFKQAADDDTSDPLSAESAIIALTSVKYFTSPYVTRQVLPEALSSAPADSSAPYKTDWRWSLSFPIGMILIGVILIGIVILKRRFQPEEFDE